MLPTPSSQKFGERDEAHQEPALQVPPSTPQLSTPFSLVFSEMDSNRKLLFTTFVRKFASLRALTEPEQIILVDYPVAKAAPS
ncbi:hypothetical protein CT19431_MP30303 [Cupriavidus taiwanensis]|nr:hypothetical protein CT19431_MP30303 [Cupriavidus taiwanensis]